MRKLTLILFLISTFSFAQKTHLFIGAKTLHGVHANYNFLPSENKSIGLNITYYFLLVDDYQLSAGGPWGLATFFRGLNQEGIGIGLNYAARSKKNLKKWHQFSLEYQKLQSGNYINNEGYFGGSSTAPYSEFHENYNNFLLSYQARKRIKNSKRFEFFYEFGVNINFIERQYTINGSYQEQIPTNETVSKIYPFPVARVGVNFLIF